MSKTTGLIKISNEMDEGHIKLLDTQKFINQNGARKIITSKTFNRTPNGDFIPNEGSFYDPAIFGLTSKDKFDKYAYIQLEELVLHPFIYKNILKVSGDFKKCINKRETYVIRDGMLVKDKAGGSGLSFIINNWNKFDFKKYETPKNQMIISLLIDSKKDLIIINKIPVIPIGYRNYRVNHGLVEEDEITDIYKKIIKVMESKDWTKEQNNTADAETLKEFNKVVQQIYKNNSKKDYLQRYTQNLYDYFIGAVEKKEGFIREILLAKRVDAVARYVMNQQPEMPIDCIGVPWAGLLIIFDLFVIAYINKDYQTEIEKANPDFKNVVVQKKEAHEKLIKDLGVANKSVEDLGNLFEYIHKNTKTYNETFPEHEKLWIQILIDIFNENPQLRVMGKRDPGWHEYSFWVLKPVIITGAEYNLILPTFSYNPLGGDSFNSNFAFEVNNDLCILKNNKYMITNKNNTRAKFTTIDQKFFKYNKNKRINTWEQFITLDDIQRI